MSESSIIQIHGVIIRRIETYEDDRGWLAELFRRDELELVNYPAMAYLSVTKPGVARGPHEHTDQSDLFCFIGPGNFEVKLWDNRKDSPSFNSSESLLVGEEEPMAVLIPPGVVHGYRNISSVDAYVINLPNRLYRGEGRSGPVDEVRHEGDPNSRFSMWE